jgi:predicted Fe-S protein YdhL (DUF1289 family)
MPRYKICWVVDKTCTICGHRSKEQFTWSFFTPEAALNEAAFILQQGHTLLFMEQ